MWDSVLTIAVIASSVFTFCLLLLPESYKPSKNRPVSVQVLVLGDIGRSPRMQYHALSIAKHGGTVQLIGYLESPPLPALIDHPRVSIIPLATPPRAWHTSNKTLFLLYAPLKVLFQIWSIWLVLAYKTKPVKWMLVQNPPSIPTLAIASIVCFFRSTRLVIDWHNFGYSILAMKLSPNHPLVKISQIYERILAYTANSHLTVTKAMSEALTTQFELEAPIHVLHDRPADLFQPFSDTQRRNFLRTSPIMAEHSQGLLQGKSRLLVSSTSWTPDEDFSVLIDALCNYSAKATSTQSHLSEIIAIITGKGPQKDEYVRKIAKLRKEGKLEKARIETAWLSFEDYASLLASADLGVSLHTSSSGVDLPMKVVDMFGTGLPVAGWSKYKAWSELVTENVNGKGFGSPDELANILVELLEPGSNQLLKLKRGALAEATRRWDEEWDPVAGSLFGLDTTKTVDTEESGVLSDRQLKAQLIRSAAALSVGASQYKSNVE